MNKLPLSKRAQIIGMLVEGNSLRATSRMADVAFNTVLKLVADIGHACSKYQDEALKNLPCKRIQVDEIWSFCYAKQKNVETAKAPVEGAGSVWTWTAICADTKLVPSWLVGSRDSECANEFITDLSTRLSHRIQLTSDGYNAYVDAIEGTFGGNIDYAMLIKLYGNSPVEDKRKYSPNGCNGFFKHTISGNPNEFEINTSIAERQNLTMRMSMRRFTRLTNAFSKKIENHAHAVSLHFMYYNFGRIHKSLRVTPAMEAGISNHVWSLEEIAMLMEDGSK